MIAKYKADSNGEGEKQVIDKVGVGLGANVSYTISILLDPVVNGGNLTYSQELAVTDCYKKYFGYTVNELSGPVFIEPGKEFAVCVKVAPGNEIFFTESYNPYRPNEVGAIEDTDTGQYYYGRSMDNMQKPKGSFPIKAFSHMEDYEEVESLTLDKYELTLNWGDRNESWDVLTADIAPENAYPTVRWISSDPQVARVVQKGKSAVVEGLSDGECTITAISYDESINEICHVNVYHTIKEDDTSGQETDNPAVVTPGADIPQNTGSNIAVLPTLLLILRERWTPATKSAAATKTGTKLVAKKKTFKVNTKVKNYKVTLKDSKGKVIKKKKVTLKIKGKTYKATTNSKGVATFKIKNLNKKGTFKAVIKFAGDSKYKAATKNVSIKVKK